MAPEGQEQAPQNTDGPSVMRLFAQIQEQLNSGSQKFNTLETKLDCVISSIDERLRRVEEKAATHGKCPAADIPPSAWELLADLDKGQRQARRLVFRFAVFGILFFAGIGAFVSLTGFKAGGILGAIGQWLQGR